MNKCEECDKKLDFFEGYYHPTYGKRNLVCGPCFLKIEESVARWREFILSNSFNPKSSEGDIISIDWNSLFNRFASIGRQLIGAEEKKSSHSAEKTTYHKLTLNHLNCDSNDALFQLDRRTV